MEKLLKTEENNVYFAALNSRLGFLSYFPTIFDAEEMKNVVIVKGGSGTGKSTMLRHFAKAAEHSGREVDYFLCSSDPKSLDGVRTRDGYAVLDGTNPHAVEAQFPGAVEELFDTGAFWNGALLKEKKSEIIDLVKQKSAHFKRAYRCLSLAGQLEEERRTLVADGVLQEKLGSAAKRQFCALGKLEQGEQVHRQVSAFGADGAVLLDTFLKLSDMRVAVGSHYGVGELYLAALLDLAKKAGVCCFYSLRPLTLGVETLYFPKARVLFELSKTGEGGDFFVNPARFLIAETARIHRGQLRFLKECSLQAEEMSAAEFAKAKSAHEKLETLYGSAMDFEMLTAAWEKKCNHFWNKGVYSGA